MNENELRALAVKLLETARREGVRPDDPQQFENLTWRVMQHIAEQAAARSEPDPDGLKPWQRDAAATFHVQFVLLAKSLLPTPPRTALLMTMYGDGELPVEIAVDEKVEIKVTLTGGEPRTFRPAAIVEAGTWRAVERVETVGLSLGYILWVGRWPAEYFLFAWDFRALIANAPNDSVDKLLARLRGIGRKHPRRSDGWFARQDREVPLQQMNPDERRVLMQQAVEDEMLDAENRRIPLRGLLRAGAKAIWDAGGTGSPYGVLQKLSSLCREETARQERQKLEVSDDETMANIPVSEAADPDHEALIRDYTAGLTGKKYEAVRHYLRAKFLDLNFKEYCGTLSLPYDATRKAARLGIRDLKEKLTSQK